MFCARGDTKHRIEGMQKQPENPDGFDRNAQFIVLVPAI